MRSTQTPGMSGTKLGVLIDARNRGMNASGFSVTSSQLNNKFAVSKPRIPSPLPLIPSALPPPSPLSSPLHSHLPTLFHDIQSNLRTVDYTSPVVVKGPVWADPPISSSFTAKWNDKDGKINRKSFVKDYQIVDGKPVNPIGRTGIIGRGLLGRKCVVFSRFLTVSKLNGVVWFLIKRGGK